LAGLLELPPGSPQGYALFAHCFTCGKDATSASRISRALAGRGYAVLRFDFTGLGSSDGDFANTNFSSNVEDLIAATEFLRSKFAAPKILIGHSLGGAAVLAAARHVPEAVAVVTIGAPASPAHVIHNFAEHVRTIERLGVAEVNLGGRPFTIRRQFIEDLKEQRQEEVIAGLRKPLLIFHSPVDTTVSIAEAAKIYAWARHPKSFVSLENADHLLTKPADAEYVADTLLAWVKRYLQDASEAAGGTARHPSVNMGQVLVAERNHRFTRSIFTDDHQWLADEPRAAGGDSRGPDPYELLLAALGACTSMTMRMYANRKEWPVQDIYVSLSHARTHSDDCLECGHDGDPQLLDQIERVIRIEGDQLTEEQRQRLLTIANSCPVHRTLTNKIVVSTRLDGTSDMAQK
jgi:putative redox protein